MDAKLLSTLDDADAHASLQHVLAAEAHQSMYPPLSIPDSNIAPELGGTPVPPQPTELESPKPEASRVGKAPSSVKRGNKDGNVISAFSGNRMRFLKKEDGEPLWRTDIQFQFLKYVFEDENKVFTKFSDGTSGHTFADIYIDTMAKSSKTSQILKDKLLSDRPGAIDMAMICLLVNVGRMNTTLNCKSLQYCDPWAHAEDPSLPRNARSSSNISSHPSTASQADFASIQAAPRRTSPEVDPQRRTGG